MAIEYYDRLTYGSSNPFIGAKLKVKRAERHLHELAKAACELPRMRGYHFVIAKREPGKLDIVFLPKNPMPLEFGGVVGDAVHNIRAAFDYVAVVISCPPYGTGKRNKVHFPTGENWQEFIESRDGRFASTGKRIWKGKMHGAESDALRIVEELEPYYGGKYSIRELHDLDGWDKHVLIVPTTSLLHVDELEFMIGDELFSLTGTDFQPNADGSNFTATIDCRGVDPEQFKRGDRFNASFTMVFGKGQPFDGQPIIPTLLNLCDVAKDFIKTCEAHFL